MRGPEDIAMEMEMEMEMELEMIYALLASGSLGKHSDHT